MPPPEAIARFRADVDTLTGTAPDQLGLAVSGGPDSMALLLLAAAAFPGRVHACSIDHALRPEAADECRLVAAACARLRVPHRIVAVTVNPRRVGIQASARAARRKAWREWALEQGLRWVLTAHHADDQAETVLMRLARGSGVAGLAGVPSTSPLGGTEGAEIVLLRPLLGWTRAELGAITAAGGLTPAQDPSNFDERFDRTRFRNLLATTDLLPPRRLAAVARHARDADTALQWMVQRLTDRHIAVHEKVVELTPDDLPRELVRRLVLEAFCAFGRYPDDGPKVDRLMTLLEAGRPATLAGIKVTPGAVWTFTEAPPRRT